MSQEIGYIKKQSISKEMRDSFLDYAMSVIVDRALPDVRDGLKPVHRRILYAMYKMGLASAAKYRKSATVVGEVLGKYHPHGDIAVYDSMVRMAQSFSLRYPLVDGQGNYGSVDGDSPAAMRYTEAKMTKLAEEMLFDIDRETVDWADNYDGTRKEPKVLPAKAPQLLLNGSIGIAVGMATSIPPHNLGELVDGIVYLIDNPNATVQDLFKFIKGPDFPTGGEIFDRQAMIQAYSAGRGPIVNRAKTEITEKKAGQFQIIVTEIPYAVNKANLIIKIAELVKTKKIIGIRDLRDESDKEGIRVVIDLKSDAQPQKVLHRLFRLTDLQKSFHLNLLALVGGIQPQVLSLKGILAEYIKHRQETVRRRAECDLRQAKEREHILLGLSKALDQIDAVIKAIKASPDRETAHRNLMKKFGLSDRQTVAILEMKLQTLAGLEQKKIKDELAEKRKLIKELEALLKSPKKILLVIKSELAELKKKYADPRRTKVYSQPVGKMSEEELVPQEPCVIILTQGGYIKRVNPQSYKAQKRGGKGIIGITPREEDAVGHFIPAATHDLIMFFTDQGKVYQTKAYEIGETSRTARGQAIVNILDLGSAAKITAVLRVPSAAEGKAADLKYLVMCTENGMIKRTKIEEFANVRRNGLTAVKLKKGDKLGWARLVSGQDEIMSVTRQGQSIRFKETDIRSMGRGAAGVRAIRLKSGDKLIQMDVVRIADKTVAAGAKLLAVTENGFGKKTDIKNYKLQKRGGSGIKTAKITEKNGKIVASQILRQEQELIAISKKGQVIKMALKDIPILGRATQGVRVMRLGKGDKVASVACI